MGSCQTKEGVPDAKQTTVDPVQQLEEGHLEEYELKKSRSGCTGMFWRADPTGKTGLLESNNDWPHDGAKLRGVVVHDKDGAKWLSCKMVKQRNSEEWKTAPSGAAMPFGYDDHYYLE